MSSINKLQVSMGFLALLLGLLVYFISRSLDTYFISFIRTSDTARCWAPPILTTLGGWLPSFLHVFAFFLFLGGLVACRRSGYLVICCSWLAIDALFELGQRHGITVTRLVPDWFEGVFLIENLKNYFLKGTFDYFDLVASSIAAAAAYGVLVISALEERRK